MEPKDKGKSDEEYIYNTCEFPGCKEEDIYLFIKNCNRGEANIWLCNNHCKGHKIHQGRDKVMPTAVTIKRNIHLTVIDWLQVNFEDVSISSLHRKLEEEIYSMIKNKTPREEIVFSFRDCRRRLRGVEGEVEDEFEDEKEEDEE